MPAPPTNALPASGGTDSLVERLADDMRRRWAAGERPLTEEYLDLHPRLRADPAAAVELIYEELCLREEHAPVDAVESVLERFPQWRQQLQALVECHRLLGAGPPATRFPEPGETLAGFQLLAELGRGSQGRVFLAIEPNMADRPVVVKVAPAVSDEHLSLARLQHTHIVPVYSALILPERGLRLLCLPYFGGASLDRVLSALSDVPPGRRSGADLFSAVGRCEAAAASTGPRPGAVSDYLRHGSYVEAVCWIGACLAEALHHAHDRGLLHLDLKPSNVLLAAGGQPLLLDFHLAQPPIARGSQPPLWLGGTPAYMPPEQRVALEAVRTAQPVPAAVDGRADVFALSTLLYEMLAGCLPPPRRPGRTLRLRNPLVSAGLADVVTRGVAPAPGDRYSWAGELATDLRRHLADLPLRGVANRSLAERWAKWRRRRPYAAPLVVLLLTAAAAGGLFLLRNQAHLRDAEIALRRGQEQQRRQLYEAATGELKRGLTLLQGIPFTGGLREEFAEPLRRAEQAQAAAELHHFADHLRTVCLSDPLPAAEAKAADAQFRRLWERMDGIEERLNPDDTGQREQVRADLLDLAVLGAELRTRLSNDGRQSAHRGALQLLVEAERRFGTSCVLYQERASHAAALGLTEVAAEAERQAAATPPKTAWELFALGRARYGAADLTAAQEYFAHALEAQPEHFWANAFLGKCAYRTGRFEEAVRWFTAAAVLAPKRGWCFYNRALALTELSRVDEALRDYDRAIELDPAFAAAALNRGVLRYRREEYAAALADLQLALERGAEPATVHFNRALVYVAEGNPAAARSSLAEALRLDPGHKDAQVLLDSISR